jgi:hypothetical protein
MKKMEKYGTCSSRQATEDNIIRRMRCSYWITKAEYTHPEYVKLLLFHGKSGYGNASQYFVIRTVLVFFLRNYIICARKYIILKY